MNYSIYLWNFRIVILNFYFIFNLIFIVRRSWIFFIETAWYKFKFIIIKFIIIIKMIYTSSSVERREVNLQFTTICWEIMSTERNSYKIYRETLDRESTLSETLHNW